MIPLAMAAQNAKYAAVASAKRLFMSPNVLHCRRALLLRASGHMQLLACNMKSSALPCSRGLSHGAAWYRCALRPLVLNHEAITIKFPKAHLVTAVP